MKHLTEKHPVSLCRQAPWRDTGFDEVGSAQSDPHGTASLQCKPWRFGWGIHVRVSRMMSSNVHIVLVSFFDPASTATCVPMRTDPMSDLHDHGQFKRAPIGLHWIRSIGGL